MIGEVVKLGFDGSAVNRGLKGVLGGFGKLRRGIGSVTKQVGIGVARQAGVTLFGTMLKGLTAIPNELNNLSALNKEIEMMGLSTGITAKRYLALRAAIGKTTGMGADEATDFVRDVSERLGEAMTDFESTPRKAMMKMKIRVGDIKGANVDDQMKVIGQKFKTFQSAHGTEAAMFQINELLGEVGKKMVPLFLNYEDGMKVAQESTKGLHDQLNRTGGQLEGIFDIKAAFKLKFSELSLGFLEGIKASGLEAKSIAGWIGNIDVAGKGKGIATVIADNMNQIKSEGIWEWFKTKMSELGAYLKEIISSAITSGIQNATSGKSLFKMFTSGGGSDSGGIMNTIKNVTKSSQDPSTAMIEANTSRTVSILERLSDNKTTSVFA